MTTTVQGKTIPLLTTNWKTQLQDIFEFTTLKVASTKKWELTELFPSLKAKSDGRETVKVTDCTYPGAKKPLRILSSLFCLNTTGHDHISIPFAELILAALNGNTIDWVEEFHQELRDEIVKLHKKHTQNQVKVERTAIGPHLTLILKAAGAMNLRHEAEAGFRTVSPSSAYKPPKKRCTDKATPTKDPQERSSAEPPKPPTPHTTVRVVPNTVIDLEQEPSDSKTSPQSTEVPKSTVIETEEPWQIPNEVPNLLQQITQTHRRLENLLTKLTNKAPPRLMRNVDHQFHKLQRETFLKESSKPGDHQPANPQAETIGSLTAQIGRLEEKLADKEELIDLYIENSFEVQTQLAVKEEETNRLKTELQTVTQRDQEDLLKIQKLEETHLQQLQAQREEAAELQQQVKKLTEETTVREGSKSGENRTAQEQIDTASSLIAGLEARLANAEELIDMYVEQSFETQTQIAEMEQEVDRLKKEIQLTIQRHQEELAQLPDLERTQLKSKEEEIARLKAEITILTHKDQDNLNRLRNVEEAGKQQLEMKEKEVETLQAQIHQLQKTAAAPSKVADHEDQTGTQQQGGGEKVTRLRNGRSSRQPYRPRQQQQEPRGAQQPQELTELARLRAEIERLQAAMTARGQIPGLQTAPEFGQSSSQPLDRTERHALAEGAANQIISDLQQELHIIKQENDELQQQLHDGAPLD